MAILQPLRLSILLALSLLSVNIVNAQGTAVGCETQNTNSRCATAQTSSSSPGTVQPKSSSLPRVTYRDGQLTITALNASLGDVLRAVSTQTGAVIEFPADRAGERFSAQTSPGPVRDVLAKLFNGSGFNYVMLASPTNPNLLQRMILTNANQPAGSSPSAVSGQPPAIAQQQTETASESETSEDGVPSVPVATAPPSLAQIANPEHLEPPKEPLSPEVLKQMVRDRMAARQQQTQQPEPQQ
jgi:hypothetical protein